MVKNDIILSDTKEKGADIIMARPQQKFTDEQKTEIINAYKKSQNVWEQKRLLCLKLRAEKSMKTSEISEIVGYKEISVKQIICKYLKMGLESILWKKKQGNRRYLSIEKEDEILKPFLEKATKGQMLIISDLKKAYEKEIRKEVPASTIYRLLSRHNWRKIIPRSKHPKAKHEEQEAYKKNH
ncbi:MAG: winged helix-turn-helix domain-containing protein [Endomicrobia bacterium]|nr:winged helix-turn-helix domain-containing protein [Endomicrobiia bacterium]